MDLFDVGKSEVSTLLQNFCAMADKQFGKSVKMIRTDNGTEFMVLKSYFQKNGIVHQTSCVDTPQQNGRVERKHRHILNIARACLFQGRLPIDFWGESVMTAAHIINRTPSSVLDGKTPYELLHGKPPVFDLLRVFGCLCYAHRRTRDKDKFGDRSRKCIFVGYPFGTKGWRLYDLDRNEFFISRDVTFLEDTFPGIKDASYVSPPVLQIDTPIDDWLAPVDMSRGSTAPGSTINPPQENSSSPLVTPVSPQTSPATPDGDHAPASSSTMPSAPTSPLSSPAGVSTRNSDQQQEPASPGLPEILGRGQRIKTPSILLKKFVTHAAQTMTPSPAHSLSDPSSSTNGSGKTPYPVANYLSTSVFNAQHQAFLATITTEAIPRNYNEAVKDPRFNGAMKTEIISLETQHTWDITTLPPGKKPISCKWLYSNKYNSDGSVERPKARLVACGNRQREGTDYKETFAPVAKMTTVRSLLRVVAGKGWIVHQMDVHNAFLLGDLKEEVYMKLPQGFKCSDPNKVLKLHKAIYGFRQAPRCYFQNSQTH